MITFKKSGPLRDTIRQIGLDRIILETDSPYLTPEPYRGKRNESSYVIHIAQTLADIFQVSIEDVGRVTTSNASSLFDV